MWTDREDQQPRAVTFRYDSGTFSVEDRGINSLTPFPSSSWPARQRRADGGYGGTEVRKHHKKKNTRMVPTIWIPKMQIFFFFWSFTLINLGHRHLIYPFVVRILP
jgi:hypothetical protein